MGFDAYGATSDAPDPVAHAINCMLDHVHVLETKMQRMCERCVRWALSRRRGTAGLDSCEIISTAEELRKMQLNETDKAD